MIIIDVISAYQNAMKGAQGSAMTGIEQFTTSLELSLRLRDSGVSQRSSEYIWLGFANGEWRLMARRVGGSVKFMTKSGRRIDLCAAFIGDELLQYLPINTRTELTTKGYRVSIAGLTDVKDVFNNPSLKTGEKLSDVLAELYLWRVEHETMLHSMRETQSEASVDEQLSLIKLREPEHV